MIRLSVQVPLTLPSVANLRQHWAAKARMVRSQRDAVYAALAPEMSREGHHPISVPCVVHIVRAAPRKLDGDNAAAACKPVRDEVARLLGVDDRDSRVNWVVDQDKASIASVHITIEWEPGGEVLPPLPRRKVAKVARRGPETESTGARIRRLATSATYRPGGGKR